MRIFLLLITLLFVIACSDKGADSKSKVYKNNFTEVGQVTFEIDSLSDFNFTEFQVVKEDGQELLLVMNRVNFSLDYYDVESGKLAKRTAIQKDEKYPIRTLYGFWHHNADSIFLFQQMSLNGISLVDGDGVIQTQFSPQKVDRSSPQMMMKSLVNHYSRVTNPTFYENGKLYFSDMTLNGFLTSAEAMEEFRPAVEVDLINKEVNVIDQIRVPDFYKGKSWQTYWGGFSRIKNDDLLIYSWAAVDSLLIFDQNMEYIKSVDAKSEFAKPIKSSSDANLTVEEQLKERITNTAYSYIFYDRYREVYYRFVTIGRDMDPSDLEDQFPHSKNDFSIIVLDKDFNILTEKRFPGKIHNPYKSFIGEKGLYLFRTNSFYEDLNEDKVVIDIVRFD